MATSHKLLLSQLAELKIDKLIINSLEQALYQVIAVVEGHEHIVWQNDSKVLLSRNLIEIREKVEHLEVGETVLRHDSCYDEMIGQPAGGNNRLEVPLGRNPYAQAKWLN